MPSISAGSGGDSPAVAHDRPPARRVKKQRSCKSRKVPETTDCATARPLRGARSDEYGRSRQYAPRDGEAAGPFLKRGSGGGIPALVSLYFLSCCVYGLSHHSGGENANDGLPSKSQSSSRWNSPLGAVH